MTLRVAIVDDEAAARARLRRLLADEDVVIVGDAADGIAALELVGRERPDLVLLDIGMPEVSGLDVARRLPDPAPLVVFQTAHGEFALEAFEREAVDYLLKPVTRERLAAAVDRARRRLAATDRTAVPVSEIAARLDALLPRSRPRRLLVRYQAAHRLIEVADIVRFVAREGLTYAVTSQGSHVADDSLDAIEHRLSPLFIRVSRADLVAVARVDRLAAEGDGSALMTLKDGTTLRVSRRRAAEVWKAVEL